MLMFVAVAAAAAAVAALPSTSRRWTRTADENESTITKTELSCQGG